MRTPLVPADAALPRFITWDSIQPGDLIRVIGIDDYAQTVVDRTGIVGTIAPDVAWTPENGLLAEPGEGRCIILLARPGQRWGARS